MQRGFIRLMIGAMAAAFALTSTIAVAQNAEFASKKEATITNVK